MIISHPYLEAEAIAWPLWSEEAFEHSLCAIERTPQRCLKPATKYVADALEEYLRPRSRGTSLDELALIRDSVWFGRTDPDQHNYSSDEAKICDQQHIPLHQYLIQLAEQRIESQGRSFHLCAKNGFLEEEAGRFRWLSLALPSELLIAAFSASNTNNGLTDDPCCEYVSLAPPLVQRMLEKGIAEVHLHIGAATSFSLLWTGLMIAAGGLQPSPEKLDKNGPPPFKKGILAISWMVTAAIARLTLASFLWRRECGESYSLRQLIDKLSSYPAANRDLEYALYSLKTGKNPLSPARLRTIYRRLVGGRPDRPPATSIREFLNRDPLSRWLPDNREVTPDTLFLVRALRFLQTNDAESNTESNTEAELFAKLFWQYVRIRNRFFRHLTFEPGTAGLDWFQRQYNRIGPLRIGLDDVLIESATILQKRDGATIKSLEVRTSPSPHWQENRKYIDSYNRSNYNHVLTKELGLVFHFTKGFERKDQRANGDPRHYAYRCRYGLCYHNYLQQAIAIERTFDCQPELLGFLRGIDICSKELAIPNWVFIPIFKRLRKYSLQIARRANVKPLQVTVHAGEDYRRLSEGLRRMHEFLEFEIMREGDRFGHGLALGDNVDRLADQAPLVMQPIDERLDDLCWELRLYREGKVTGSANRIEFVRSQIEKLADYVINGKNPRFPSPKANDMVEARRLRHDPRALDVLAFPWGYNCDNSFKTNAELTPLHLLNIHLTDATAYMRGQQPLEVRITDDERIFLHQAQLHIRKMVSRMSITIEINPSSNLLIGDTPIDSHPVFRLMPLPGSEQSAQPELAQVHVALGDDDPILFASSVPEEFSHLYYTLLRKGVPSPVALEWLNQVRENGIDARFTIPTS